MGFLIGAVVGIITGIGAATAYVYRLFNKEMHW